MRCRLRGRSLLLGLLLLLIRAAAQCDDKESAMYRCLYSVNLLAATECEACVSDAVPTTVNYCQELTQACDVIPDCPCAPCGYEIMDYVTCGLQNVTGCPLNCSEAILRLASEAGTPCEGWGCGSDGTVACQAERDQYSECLNDSDRLLSCEQCLASAVPLSVSGVGCDDYRNTLCASVGTYCRESCALSCLDQLESYLQCSISNKLNETCDMRCGWNETLSRNEEPVANTTCSTYATSLKTCLFTYELGSEIVDLCPLCVMDAFGSNVTSASCSDMEGGVCAALGDCDCGACQSYVSAYFDCVASSIPASCGDAQCNLHGVADDAGGADDAATVAPAVICSSQFVGIKQCLLVNEIGTELGQTCPTCVSNSFPVGTELNTVSCDALESIVCPSLASCDCGACSADVASYFDCVAASTTPSCDGLSYDGACTGGGGSPTPAASGGATPSAAPASAPSAGGVPTPRPPEPSPSKAPSPSSPSAPTLGPVPRTVPPSGAPATAPTAPSPPVAAACAAQDSRMRDCLENRLTLSQSGCVDCVKSVDEALYSPIADCGSIRSALCSIVGENGTQASCDCGACTDAILEYYECAVERATGTGNCSVDCGGTEPPSSSVGGRDGLGGAWGLTAAILMAAVMQ